MASNPMQQFTVHRIGPEIKIAGIDFNLEMVALPSGTFKMGVQTLKKIDLQMRVLFMKFILILFGLESLK